MNEPERRVWGASTRRSHAGWRCPRDSATRRTMDATSGRTIYATRVREAVDQLRLSMPRPAGTVTNE
jgi:hypothetical protein